MNEVEPFGRLINLTAKVLRERFEDELAQVGSSMTSFIVLQIAQHNPAISQRKLAALLGIEGPTLTHHLDRLAADGLVRRVTHSDDRRVSCVEVTPEGRGHLAAIKDHVGRLDERLSSLMSDRELATVRRVLNRIRDHYSKEAHVYAAD